MTPIKTTLSLLVLTLALLSCQNKGKTDKTIAKVSDTSETVDREIAQEEILIGRHARKELEKAPYNKWFSANYDDYTIDENILKEIKPLANDIRVKVFMGTWCSDSQHQVPVFFKIMDKAGYHYNDFTLITMSRNKTTPDNFEKGLNITNVPTFIFYKDGEEINRIVEYPIGTLEKDMLDILQGKPYKNAYAE